MVWDATTPVETDQFTAVATTDFRATKQMIRERMEAPNGSVYEHHESSDDSFGVHEGSKVSWLKWHTTYAALVAYCSPVASFESTLHYVKTGTEKGLYTVRAGSLVRLTTNQHSDLIVTDAAEDHSQYIEKEKTNIDGPIAYEESTVTLHASSLTISEGDGDDELIPESHNSAVFEDVHGDFTLSMVDDNTLTPYILIIATDPSCPHTYSYDKVPLLSTNGFFIISQVAV